MRAIFQQKVKVECAKDGRGALYFSETDVATLTDVDTSQVEAHGKLVKRAAREALSPESRFPHREESDDRGVDEYDGDRTFESDEETLLGGESPCDEGEEYFKLLRSSCASDTETLSEMIGRDILTRRLVIMLNYFYYVSGNAFFPVHATRRVRGY